MMPWPIVGHELAVQQIRQAVAGEDLSHALLITGPENVGKMTLARIIAKSLLCKAEAETRPCEQCTSCKRIESGNHPDFIIIEPENPERPTIKVQQIRELERFLHLTPTESRHKIAIITTFESATIGAANALLKTLEEPPAYVHLFLLASNADTLLPTIVSRSQQVTLRPLERKKIARALVERWQIQADKAQRLARLSGGRLGWAVRAATDNAYLERMESAQRLLLALLVADLPTRFEHAQDLAKSQDTAQLIETLEYWLTGWRDVLLLQAQNDTGLTYTELKAELEHVAQAISINSTVAILQAVVAAQTALFRNANTQLLMENLLLDFPYIG
ncbi:MAG: DNA polymerase III subunit delta' [Anaerolineae bacterium]|nr:DNA polymerase III subunit delta' [Anaerolineae bacterium]